MAADQGRSWATLSIHAAVSLSMAAALAAPTLCLSSEPSDSTAVQCIDVRSGTSFEFHAKRLLPTGVIDTTWSPGEGQLCLGSLNGVQRSTVSDGAGGAFVGWVESSNPDPKIYLQRFNGSGDRVAGWPSDGLPVCPAPGSQYQLDVVADGSGGVFLAWQDYRNGRGQVFVQRVSGLGEVTSGWPVDGRAVTDTLIEQSTPKVGLDGVGGLWVVWQSRHGKYLRLFMQRLTAGGAIASGWPANGVAVAQGPDSYHSAAIGTDSLGRALIVWQQVDTLGQATLTAARVTAQDNPISWNPSLVTLAEASAFSAAVVQRMGPDVVAVWGQWQGGSASIRAQRIALGTISTQWGSGGTTVCQGLISHNPTMVLADASGVFVAWTDFRNASSAGSDVYVQHLTAAGSVSTGWPANGLVAAGGDGDQYAPWLARDGEGGTIITWSDAGLSASGGFVSSAQLSQGWIPTLSELGLRSSQVRIVWNVGLAHRDSFEVERQTIDEPWRLLTKIAPDDSGHVVVIDRSAPQGSHVEYRLALTVGDTRWVFDPISLDIPVAPTVLSLGSVRMAQGAIQLSFALPAGSAPVVEVIDVAGRRLLKQVMNGLDPGEYDMSLKLERPIPSGVYFVRLIQGSQTRTMKTAYLR